jgi:fructan beta-fructosidase
MNQTKNALSNLFGLALVGCSLIGKTEAAEENQFQTFPSYKEIGYDQPYRPKFHFTSLKNWINDPNGMVYYDGEYHLFFQHNPLGMGWGNMTWGHAISTDMVHWTQQPHKILPFGNGYPFSGTGLVDHNNSLGKQVGDTKTLVFMYSYALDDRPRFGVLPPPKETNYHQAIAYSTDKGRTLRLLNDGGPAIPNQGREVDPKGTERDPKIFWHEPSRKWVAILWLGEASGGKVRFFNSDDLQHWIPVSDITRKWAHECFDLVELNVLDEAGKPLGEKKWLIYDGSLDYEVGSFDGKEFKAEQPVKNDKLGDWNAAQTFNNSPDGRTVIIGWLVKGNFYRKKMPFTEQLSFPATLELRKVGTEYQLYRWPIKEIESLRSKSWSLPKDISATEANAKLAAITPECFDLSVEFQPEGDKDVVLSLRGSVLTYSPAKKCIHFIGSESAANKAASVGKSAEEIKKLGISEYVMPNALRNGSVKLRILVDRGSFEIFLNDGETVLTHSVISELDNKSISITGDAVIKSAEIHELKSSWDER